MKLVQLSSKLIKLVNQLIIKHNDEQETRQFKDSTNLIQIKERLKKILKLLSKAEKETYFLMNCIFNVDELNVEPIYIRSGGSLVGIIPKKILKPVLPEIQKVLNNCNCHIEPLKKLKKFKNLVYIENEEDLIEIDSRFDEIFVECFIHSYRTAVPFICWITIFDKNGTLFVIDAIKFREIISKLRFLNCGVKKLIHCRDCVKNLIIDFGDIGCYYNILKDQDEKDGMYFDYRIRPFNEIFKSLMVSSLFDSLKLLNINNELEHYVFNTNNSTSVFENNTSDDAKNDYIKSFYLKNGINYKIEGLDDVLKFREFLSKEENESNFFIMPDSQVITFLETRPKTIKEFSSLFEKVSPMLRLHATDFMLILKKRYKTFSVENLMDSKNLNTYNSTYTNKNDDEYNDILKKEKDYSINRVEQVYTNYDDLIAKRENGHKIFNRNEKDEVEECEDEVFFISSD